MRNRIMMLVFAAFLVVIGSGQWYWHKQLAETTKEAREFQRNHPKQWEYHEATPRETTLIELKEAFIPAFQEALVEYEETMGELLLAAREEYVKRVLPGDMTSYQLVSTYQAKALEAEEELRDWFWVEYVGLQDRMEEAGYYRDEAFEFELEIELRVEQMTHLFLYELMMMEQSFGGRKAN
ncbi:hypothetical protein [Halalkalibacter urbisdiaboli]|uniref:hypothetical protein n=1 Tax=Halalkalibacter urbisdiaboli TaxID=1960589 RepID=UPI000B452E9D|nr:hypothetical protein [Halalkalibacter urbisdiaboli]